MVGGAVAQDGTVRAPDSDEPVVTPAMIAAGLVAELMTSAVPIFPVVSPSCLKPIQSSDGHHTEGYTGRRSDERGRI
jgi:hypothetical protein